ncbi:hypothetical protein [Phenylobacterium sp.]|uniref:hypothetical protein n=1 Tax=Phenylobacterium sp. TaxID=1871053 RepID=UPI0025E37A09|nr:hypothetical protein [Phenylobacterium sp.]MBX3482665.1 hypothetical protein [Phenylobacterium sp.]MCW5760492.1 hypothetical protein [Phenylobacterium sp.]
MQALITWAGRAALLGVLAVAFAGAIDPHHDARRNAPPADVVEHVAYGYLLTVLTIASLPRASPWLIGAGFLGVAMGFELMQALGLVSGTFQWKDVAANIAGVAAALAPLALADRLAPRERSERRGRG